MYHWCKAAVCPAEPKCAYRLHFQSIGERIFCHLRRCMTGHRLLRIVQIGLAQFKKSILHYNVRVSSVSQIALANEVSWHLTFQDVHLLLYDTCCYLCIIPSLMHPMHVHNSQIAPCSKVFVTARHIHRLMETTLSGAQSACAALDCHCQKQGEVNHALAIRSFGTTLSSQARW